MKSHSLLIADDNKNVLTALDLLLSGVFNRVKCLSNPNLSLQELKEAEYSAVLLDMNFKSGQKSGNEGLFWLKEILKTDPDLSVVMFTAFGDIELAVKALKEGAVDFVLKPWDNQKLIATLKAAIKLTHSRREVHNLKTDNNNLKEGFRIPPVDLIGKSAAMKEVMKVVRKVANTSANVLITGENGTGKELIAREIHNLSNRSEEVMITVDLGAVPETLFESELFGHVKGAFTDAHSHRTGRIESANKGTLFFDEIGNLPLPLQSKLLSVIQKRSISRIGDNQVIPVDVRILCATNMNLQEMVEKGEFRMDLLYRINTIQVEVPPLRDRGEDILLLAEYYLEKFASRYRKPGLVLTDTARKALMEWKWPGNVRELQHTMEKAVILAEKKQLETIDMHLKSRHTDSLLPMDGSLGEVESHLIRYSIRKNHGNLSAVATQLGISRQTLYNKIEKYGLEKI